MRLKIRCDGKSWKKNRFWSLIFILSKGNCFHQSFLWNKCMWGANLDKRRRAWCVDGWRRGVECFSLLQCYSYSPTPAAALPAAQSLYCGACMALWAMGYGRRARRDMWGRRLCQHLRLRQWPFEWMNSAWEQLTGYQHLSTVWLLESWRGSIQPMACGLRTLPGPHVSGSTARAAAAPDPRCKFCSHRVLYSRRTGALVWCGSSPAVAWPPVLLHCSNCSRPPQLPACSLPVPRRAPAPCRRRHESRQETTCRSSPIVWAAPGHLRLRPERRRAGTAFSLSFFF